MRVLFHVMVIVPFAVLAFVSFVLVLAIGTAQDAISLKAKYPGRPALQS